MAVDYRALAADVLEQLQDVDAKELQKGVSVPLKVYLDAEEIAKLQRQMNEQGYYEYGLTHMRGERRVIVVVTRW